MSEIDRSYEQLHEEAYLGTGDFEVSDNEAYTIISRVFDGPHHVLDKRQQAWMAFITGQARFVGRPLIPRNKTDWFKYCEAATTWYCPVHGRRHVVACAEEGRVCLKDVSGRGPTDTTPYIPCGLVCLEPKKGEGK
jgi:hypothetical protein